MTKFLLHIETATEICSVAISKDGIPISSMKAEKDQSHSSDLNPLIQKILVSTKLNWKNLSGITVSNGPGSYTGLRIGTTTAKALCFGLGIPYVPLPTLQIIARNMVEKYPLENAYYLPLIDARRMEVYTAVFNNKGEYLEKEQNVIIANDIFNELQKSGGKIVIGGNSNDKFRKSVDWENLVSVEDELCASFQSILGFETLNIEKQIYTLDTPPLYLKKANITSPRIRTL